MSRKARLRCGAQRRVSRRGVFASTEARAFEFTASEKIWKVFEPNPLLHSSTFGGNELACAAALAAIDEIINNKLSDNAAETGEYLINGLYKIAEKYPGTITAVRGKGLLIGVEFTDRDIAALVIAGFAQQKILAAYTLNNPCVIRFEPPLIITKDHIDIVLSAFDKAISGVMDLLQE